ncbi:MAG: sec-independent protein translocase protein TatB [Myxococcota bacterium]|jgi:sec-independent protein translocase protein TatB
MLGLGIGEMLVIGALVLVVVGPDRLPQALRWAGQNYGKLRRTADELRRAFVLEADRQDADERLDKLRERQKAARELADAEARAAEASTDDAPVSEPMRATDRPVGQKRTFPAPPPEDDTPSLLPPEDSS